MANPDQKPAETASAEPKLVNAGELCRALGRSRPWLDQRLIEDPRFPVVARGGKGAQWQFNLADATAYVGAQDTLRALAAVATPQARLAKVRAQMAEMELAVRLGKLIDAEEMHQVLGAGFASLGAKIDSTLDQLARRHGWDEAVRHDAGEAFDTARREFVAEVGEPLHRDAGAIQPEDRPDLT